MKKYRIIEQPKGCFALERRLFFFFWENIEYYSGLDSAKRWLEYHKRIDAKLDELDKFKPIIHYTD